MVASLFMLQLVSGCGDDRDGESQGSSTTGENATGGSATDGNPTGDSTSSDSTSSDVPTTGSTDSTGSGSTSGDSTTGDSGDASLCHGACDQLVACEIEENFAECLAWCESWEQDAAMADPRVFPECANLVEDLLECIAQDDACFEGELCSNLDLAVEEQCSCDRNSAGNPDDCTYDERCAAVTREVQCTGGTCVCTVNGEFVGECQSQAMICVDPMLTGIEPLAIAAGECCGWIPFEGFD